WSRGRQARARSRGSIRSTRHRWDRTQPRARRQRQRALSPTWQCNQCITSTARTCSHSYSRSNSHSRSRVSTHRTAPCLRDQPTPKLMTAGLMT
ncbi:hypothetical protein E8E12_000133, partial [Didymella heteroderae]